MSAVPSSFFGWTKHSNVLPNVEALDTRIYIAAPAEELVEDGELETSRSNTPMTRQSC
jgi:hypothetical protein